MVRISSNQARPCSCNVLQTLEACVQLISILDGSDNVFFPFLSHDEILSPTNKTFLGLFPFSHFLLSQLEIFSPETTMLLFISCIISIPVSNQNHGRRFSGSLIERIHRTDSSDDWILKTED